jgi:meiotically up-regulated gene 157 (Mug157) protein
MIWSGFRPSDDPPAYCYSIPANIYVVGALQRLQVLNSRVWNDPQIGDAAASLAEGIQIGIRKFGVVPLKGGAGVSVYAYEVDGLGNGLVDFDDPNIPSLLSIPLLGWGGYDQHVYAATRARILSRNNSYFFEGTRLSGLGSPHTYSRYVWPLATAIEACTTTDVGRQALLLRHLTQMANANGFMHESVHVDDPDKFSRAEFGWANAMLVVAVERLLGVDCDRAAESYRLQVISERESKEPHTMPNKGRDMPLYYETLEAAVQHV